MLTALAALVFVVLINWGFYLQHASYEHEHGQFIDTEELFSFIEQEAAVKGNSFEEDR